MDVFNKFLTQVHNAGKTWSFSQTEAGRRYEVRGGDTWGGATTERSETASAAKWAYNQEISLSYNFKLETGEKNKAAWTVIGQLFSQPDVGETGWSPPFAIEMVGDRMRVTVRSSSEDTIKTNPVGRAIYTDSADILREHDYKMDIKIVLDPYGKGHVEVRRDGVLLVSYDGPVGYPDEQGVYWKEGIYRSPTDQTMAAEYSDLRIGYTNSDASADKVIDGTSGADSRWGGAGDDTMFGKDGADKLYGQVGNDKLYGGNGDDLLEGMDGADVIDGGAGRDRATYALSDAAVLVNLAEGVGKDGDAEGDSLLNIEDVIGSNFDDILIGNGGQNRLEGGAGGDLLQGGGLYDILDGGEGQDIASYATSSAGVNVSLVTNRGSGGDAEGDMLINVENLVGSDFNDHLIGNGVANILLGGRGADMLNGGRGNDRLVGGDGNDVLLGGAGNDRIEGGTGKDTAVFVGNASDYLIERLDDGTLRIADRISGRDGSDILSDIETVMFKDGSASASDLRSEQMVRNYDSNWKLIGYELIGHQGNVSTHKVYDQAWRLKEASSTTHTADGETTRFYDANWQQTGVEVIRDADGIKTQTVYDGAFKSMLSETKTYSDAAGTHVEQFDGRGKLLASELTTTSGNQTTIKDFDAMGRLIEKLVSVISGPSTTTTKYNVAGEKLAVDITRTDGDTAITKHYDGKGRLIGNTMEVDKGSIVDVKEYDANWKLLHADSFADATYLFGTGGGQSDLGSYAHSVSDYMTSAQDHSGAWLL